MTKARRRVKSSKRPSERYKEQTEPDLLEAEDLEDDGELTPAELERLALQTHDDEIQVEPEPGTLVRCPDCGNVISRSATSCPHCGKPFAGQGWMLGCARILLILVIAGLGIALLQSCLR